MGTKKKPAEGDNSGTEWVFPGDDAHRYTGSDNVVASPETARVVGFGDIAEFAVRLGVELSGTVDERADSAAQHMSSSQRHMLASGLLLMSIKADCDHGRFTALLKARGFEERPAQRAMQYAQFILERPADEREKLIGLPKTKVLLLASADPEVVEAMLEDGTGRIDALSVRALQQELADAKAALVDTAVERDTAQAEALAAKKQLEARPDREDGVPLAIAALRAEFMELYKKAELSLSSFDQVGRALKHTVGADDPEKWGEGTLRLALAALAALRVQLDGCIKNALRELPGEVLADSGLQSYLTTQEKHELADRFFTLADVHGYEKKMRDHLQQEANKAGPGRPKKAPKAPKGAQQ